MSFKSLGKRIKTSREELRFTQDEMSRSMGFLDRQTLSAIETGVRDVSAEDPHVRLVDILDERIPCDLLSDRHACGLPPSRLPPYHLQDQRLRDRDAVRFTHGLGEPPQRLEPAATM